MIQLLGERAWITCATRRRLRLLVQPRPDAVGIIVIEISDGCFGEGFAKLCQAVLPSLVPDHRQSRDVRECAARELRVAPQRTEVPAFEVVGHIEQQSQSSMRLGKSDGYRDEFLVVRFCQRIADVNDQHPAAIFFYELNGHFIF